MLEASLALHAFQVLCPLNSKKRWLHDGQKIPCAYVILKIIIGCADRSIDI
jgi:hypothetical protein